MEVCTTSERLLEGIGTATFLSTCLANTACTASVWTSERGRGGEEEKKKKKRKRERKRVGRQSEEEGGGDREERKRRWDRGRGGEGDRERMSERVIEAKEEGGKEGGREGGEEMRRVGGRKRQKG